MAVGSDALANGAGLHENVMAGEGKAFDELRGYVGVSSGDENVVGATSNVEDRLAGNPGRTYDTARAGELMKEILGTARNDLADGMGRLGVDVDGPVVVTSGAKAAPDERGLDEPGFADGPDASVGAKDEAVSF